MPYNQGPSEYFGWYFRYNTRTTFSHFNDAGMDLFASPADQNPQAFLDLTNLLPAMSGGFRRRWGLTSVVTGAGVYSGVGHVGINPVRTFAYNAPQDATNPSGTADTNNLIFTDGQILSRLVDTGSSFTWDDVFTESVTGAATPFGSGFISREFFYYSNGASSTSAVAIKSQLNNTGAAVWTNWGITYPPSASANQGNLTVTGWGTGSGYTTNPAITFADVLGGGSGAAAYGVVVGGQVQTYVITNAGTGYIQPSGGADAPTTGSNYAETIAYTDLNTANATYGKIVALLPAGPMSFAAGRTYTFALMNSVTGHVSDVSMATVTTGTNQALPNLTDVVFSQPTNYGITNQPLSLGWTDVSVQITLGPTLDPQVDTVLLLATSDGGSLENLYEVASIPLSSFTGSPLAYTYVDSTPDTYSTMYLSGPTLLTNQIYESTDGFGDLYGIVGNTPPPNPLLYPVTHQGRIFGTDGKTVFFSKSLVDVTTASGLISCKWEEAWPGDNQLPIALTDETITALKSDGTNLHVGTTRGIYTVYGTDPTNFSVPNNQFAQVGVLSNDLWTVVYSQGQPTGFVWITPDYKIMWSDFNTYVDIGTPVYPLIEEWDSTFQAAAKLEAFTEGPYNLCALCYKRTTSATAEFLIYEAALQKWYRWEFGSPGSFLQPKETGPLCSFVYVHPSTGARYLYFFTLNTGTTQSSRYYIAPPSLSGLPGSGTSLSVYRFDPAAFADLGSTGIGWNVQTTWQDMGDHQVVKVLNEIDIISDETNLQVAVFGAFTESDLETFPSLASGATTVGPLGNTKFYLAGLPTKARWYSFNFFSTNPGTTSPDEVLGAFTIEHCPISRI